MKRLSLVLLSLITLNVWAAGDLTNEMDALGANRELMKKAKAIDPKNRVRVVQNREVDRYYRLELGVNYGFAAGGDPYVNTSLLGGQMDFHFTPRVSLGARYYNASNSLTSEGKQVFDDAEARKQANDPNFRRPGVDYAKDQWLVVANWYPMYGKVNLFDVAISQFDIYVLGGGGQINLSSGTAPLYTAGGGLGIWWNQHFSTRLEARWQGYQDRIFDGQGMVSRDINQTLLTATMGFLL
jgi:outer membrane immunogenic protein